MTQRLINGVDIVWGGCGLHECCTNTWTSGKILIEETQFWLESAGRAVSYRSIFLPPLSLSLSLWCPWVVMSGDPSGFDCGSLWE